MTPDVTTTLYDPPQPLMPLHGTPQWPAGPWRVRRACTRRPAATAGPPTPAAPRGRWPPGMRLGGHPAVAKLVSARDARVPPDEPSSSSQLLLAV